jgi:BlaI family transcriptional regulator, penicillinase repressor
VYMSLSKAEEQVMQYLWQLDKAFLKDILQAFPEPKPATTTVVTLLKRMQDKGFVNFTLYGNSREYYPLISKETYYGKQVANMIENSFNNSALQFASFFTQNTKLSTKELEALKTLIDNQLKTKRK